MGAIEHHALGQAKASLTNAFWQLVMFKLRPEMNDALVETLRMPLRRAGITASLTPNVEVCQEGDGHACNRAIREGCGVSSSCGSTPSSACQVFS